MTLTDIANDTIKQHREVKDLRKRKYNTQDIIELTQEVIRTDTDDTDRFAKHLPKNIRGLKELFDFVDQNFEYSEDPDFNQWVQTPSYLWYTKKGDCKSYTVFISSVLSNMGMPHLIRYVSYGGPKYTHVFPVAILGGREIPLDVVWKKQSGGPFGRQKRFTKKKDFKMNGLYKLGNTYNSPEAIIGQINSSIEEMEALMADIPDSIVDEGPGDVTRMTSGELDRHIWTDRYKIYADQEQNPDKADQYRDAARALEQGSIAGIGSLKNDPLGNQVQAILMKTAQDTKRAFEPYKIQIPNPVQAGLQGGFFKKVGNFLKKAVKTIGELHKKLLNWVFKGVGKKMGPYFIFMFLKKNVIKSKEIKRRRAEQEKTFDWLAKTGKFDKEKLMGLAKNGIKEDTGKSVEDIVKEGKVPSIAGWGAIIQVVIKAIGWLVKIIGKVVGLFKKKKSDAGAIGESNMSDPSLLDEEYRLQNPQPGPSATPSLLPARTLPNTGFNPQGSNYQTQSASGGGGGGGSTALIIGGGLVAALLLLK